ncbi:MAG TPA: hypothetical protein DD640_03690 [Clostridiales bacterium]|nr:hypothetical protein [Clostridiales bacterium]
MGWCAGRGCGFGLGWRAGFGWGAGWRPGCFGLGCRDGADGLAATGIDAGSGAGFPGAPELRRGANLALLRLAKMGMLSNTSSIE